jgi:hypothetical protein
MLVLRSTSLSTASFLAFTSHYALILLFTAAYRLSSFHPLAAYPGPVLPRLSKWYAACVSQRGDVHHWIRDLHEEFGDIVRVGPNELSIRDADAVPALLDYNGLPKGPCKHIS